MIRFLKELNGWYSDATLEGDYVSLHRDSHISVNGKRIELPPGQSNLLQLVCTRYKDEILIAGQGQSHNNWLYKYNKWIDLGPSFATFPCAFSSNYLYCVVGNNQYCIYDLEKDTFSDPINRQIGSNGIRYIDFSQSHSDGIVTGDETYGPGLYNLSQYTKRDSIVIGQSYIDGAVAFYNDIRYKIEPGDTQFIRFKKDADRICISIVKMLERAAVFYWMSVEDLKLFPLVVEASFPIDVKDPDKPLDPSINNMKLECPNLLETVKRMMRIHTEIDLLDEEERGDILDYIAKASGNPSVGRKARNKDGSNKNTDGLTYLRSDGKFEIYDVISGSDLNPDNKDRVKFATWDLGLSPSNQTGIWEQGENGYWAPANPVSDGKLPPTPHPGPGPIKPQEPIPDPIIKEVIVNKPRVNYEEMMAFIVKVNDTFAETKLGKKMNALPEHTQAHIMWRYFFEHDSYSDDKLIEEVRLRGNEQWRD